MISVQKIPNLSRHKTLLIILHYTDSRKLFFDDCNMKMSLSAEEGEYVGDMWEQNAWTQKNLCYATHVLYFRTGTTGFLKSLSIQKGIVYN